MKIELQAKTEGQQNYIDLIKSKKIIFAEGVSGSGKSFIPCLMALEGFYQHQYDKIIISRPTVINGNTIGFLPGLLEEKMAPLMYPLMDVFSQTVGKGELEKLIKNKTIEIAPVEYLRGRTFLKSFVILDEFQNATYDQFVLALTRFGKGSKMVITGDSSQCDLPVGDSGLIPVMEKIDGISEIGIVRLTSMDIVREPIIKKILERLS